MAEIKLETDIQFVPKVGEKVAKLFRKLGIQTASDLVYTLPKRYEDRSHLPPIKSIVPGVPATVRGRIVHFDIKTVRGGRAVIKVILKDASGSVTLTWFNQPWIAQKLKNYSGELIVYGNPKFSNSGIEFSSPEYELIEEGENAEEFARLTPVYGLTEGLSQKKFRSVTKTVVESVIGSVVDPLPATFRKANRLRDLKWCLTQIHVPDDAESAATARTRLVFEEFFLLQLALAMRQSEMIHEHGIAFPIDNLTMEKPEPMPTKELGKKRGKGKIADSVEIAPAHLFVEEAREKYNAEPLWDQIHRLLPFNLTNSQRKVIEEIFGDMRRPYPMNRLLQGDVGSGKTAVAGCAMLAAVRSGFQCAIMAPTEILAEQHYMSLKQLFEPIGLEIVLVLGKHTAREKKHIREQIASGTAEIVIGTHALISEGVEFHNLGLIIVDEQHRFGVLQRAKLREKSALSPDVLIMTATPIPRTLALTVFGDLDQSTIDELPVGRKPIKTHLKYFADRNSVYDSVQKLIEKGRQAYFVCPRVSDNEEMTAQAAEELYGRLRRSVYPDLRLGLLHGKMKPKDKESVMNAFRTNELDILVATTVIEVGVDVPNATVIVIHDANRFGLSQLHQLRGRVGRGSEQSYCILLSGADSEEGNARLDEMVKTSNGFEIAEADMNLRGAGDVAGTQQSGNLNFRFGSVVKDREVLEDARKVAREIISKNETLEGDEWALVRERVGERRSHMALITIS